jgi:cobalt-zinc-cadmium efflux system membrane fusion protein
MKSFLVLGQTVLIVALLGCTSSDKSASSPISDGRPTRTDNVVRFDPASPQLERLRVAAVIEAVLPVDELDVPGKIEAVPARLARLALPAPGRVRSVGATIGDRVRQGQILLTLETAEVSQLQSAWRQAQADVRQREAALAKANADVSRARDLLANRAIAQKDVLVAETDLAVATAALEQARATEDDVARRLAFFGVNAEQRDALATVRSPIAGDVVEVAIAPGDYRTDTAAPVITVADLAHVWVTASVPESALAQIQTGQRVTVIVTAYPDRPFEGRVARVADTLDPDTRTVRMIVELDNAKRLLKPEMFARVRYAGPARRVVTVPAGAIVQDERRPTVFVERAPGEFERKEVSLGPRRGDTVVVASGLRGGDRVVFDGTMLLMAQ